MHDNNMTGCARSAEHGSHIRCHLHRQQWAFTVGEGEQSLFAGMQHAVEGKHNIEVAGEQSGHTMVDADDVAAPHRAFDLMQIRRHDRPEHRVIVHHDVASQRLRVRLHATCLQCLKPTMWVKEAPRLLYRSAERGRISQARLVCFQHAGDLLLHPGGAEIHTIDGDPGRCIDPKIGAAPIRQVQIVTGSTARLFDHCCLSGARQLGLDVHIQIDVRFDVCTAVGL